MKTDEKNILVIEDEYVVRESLRAWLKDNGYEVECVETGEEALERIEAKDYDFLVLDIRLPGIDGIEVYRRAKKIKPNTKGAIITAYPLKDAWEEAHDLGLVHFLPKPFEVADLEKIIDGTLGEIKGQDLYDKNAWLQLGAGPYKMCDRNYDCANCPIEQMMGTYDRYLFLSDERVNQLKNQPDGEKWCRYGTLHVHHRDKPYME